jgi:hypothetical protein
MRWIFMFFVCLLANALVCYECSMHGTDLPVTDNVRYTGTQFHSSFFFQTRMPHAWEFNSNISSARGNLHNLKQAGCILIPV